MIEYTNKECIRGILERYRWIEAEIEKGNEEAMIVQQDLLYYIGQISLTDQESQILIEVLDGKQQGEIAEELDIAQGNISRTIARIIDKIVEEVEKRDGHMG